MTFEERQGRSASRRGRGPSSLPRSRPGSCRRARPGRRVRPSRPGLDPAESETPARVRPGLADQKAAGLASLILHVLNPAPRSPKAESETPARVRSERRPGDTGETRSGRVGPDDKRQSASDPSGPSPIRGVSRATRATHSGRAISPDDKHAAGSNHSSKKALTTVRRKAGALCVEDGVRPLPRSRP